MKLHSDRQGCALSAITLIENHNTRLGDVVDMDSDIEVATVLSAAVWCGHILAAQLAHHTGLDRSQIIAALRQSVAEAFTNPKGESR